mmetsp:Transcript_33045/g.46920  ORF Transcript_33045/g.46920 Transcript_33045/m.46920 type:complete len:402 (-) Transcript_33045:29-1234(-)
MKSPLVVLVLVMSCFFLILTYQAQQRSLTARTTDGLIRVQKKQYRTVIDAEQNEIAFQRRRLDELSDILTKQTVLAFHPMEEFPVLVKKLEDQMVDMVKDEDNAVPWERRKPGWTKESNRFIVRHINLCAAVKDFQRLDNGNKMKPHVLLTSLGQNWGAVSTYVNERTVNWGSLSKILKDTGECTTEELFEYLHHPHTLAVITTQHQAFNHPKIHSIPIGINEHPSFITKNLKKSDPETPRSNLLMINFATDNKYAQHRKQVAEVVIENFQKSSRKQQPVNTYGYGTLDDFYKELQVSKYVLGPSGLGWDCHRFWEALYMGSIPVIETYYRDDGWRRVMDDLPILWVDHFRSVTPELLEEEYPKLMAKWESYRWEKLTIPYWVDFVKSFHEPSTELHNLLY